MPPPTTPWLDAGFFTADLAEVDPEVSEFVGREFVRQRDQMELIAPKTFASLAAIQAMGSIMANTVVEGYPGRRYHAGAVNVDAIENLAIERAKQLFGCRYANVQVHAGSQANQISYLGLLKPGDTVLSMSLDDGGHLSHGAAPSLLGRWFNVVQYGVREGDGLLDYDRLEALARQHRPRMIVAGGSAYPRAIDFERFGRLAKEVGAYFLADIAHFASMVAAGLHTSPFPHADVVTTTTCKSLRGMHSALVLSDDDDIAQKLKSALFPGLQGGPIVEVLVSKAVTLGELLRPEFKAYARAVQENARSLAATLAERGFDIVCGGTDMPLLIVSLVSKGLTGDVASRSLERAGLPCNMNLIPFDREKPTVTSGLRLGTSGVTLRGVQAEEMRNIGHLVAGVLEGLAANPGDNSAVEAAVSESVAALCRRYPIYPEASLFGAPAAARDG